MTDEIKKLVDEARSKNDLNELRRLTYETNNNSIRYSFAFLCMKSGKYEIAKEEFYKLLDSNRDVDAKLNLGRIAIREKQYDIARKYFESILDTYRASRAEYELGRLELNLKNINKAKEHFLKSIEENEDAFSYFELGKIEVKLGNNIKAEKYFTKALNIKKNDSFIKFELSRVKNSNGKYDESEILLNELISYRKSNNLPIDGYQYLELIKCYLGKKNYEKARELLEELYEIFPKDNCVRYFFGILEFHEKNYVKSKKIFEQVLKETYDASCEFHLGVVQRILGNVSSARKHLNNCLNKYKYKYETLFELGLLEFRLGNLNKAINYLELAIEENGINKIIYKSLILMYLKNGDLKKAACFIEKYPFMKEGLDIEILLYLSKQLNIFYKELEFYYNSLTYGQLQLLDYDEYVAVDYIDENYKFNFKKNFSEIDLYSLFIILKDKLSGQNKLNRLSTMDIYIVKYNDTLIKVVTLPNSNEIISLYPLIDDYKIYNDEAKKIIDVSKVM